MTGTRVELPESGIVDSFNIQTFDPTSVEASVVVLSHLREQPVGQVEPSNAAIRFATTFYDINEIRPRCPTRPWAASSSPRCRASRVARLV